MSFKPTSVNRIRRKVTRSEDGDHFAQSEQKKVLQVKNIQPQRSVNAEGRYIVSTAIITFDFYGDEEDIQPYDIIEWKATYKTKYTSYRVEAIMPRQNAIRSGKWIYTITAQGVE